MVSNTAPAKLENQTDTELMNQPDNLTDVLTNFEGKPDSRSLLTEISKRSLDTPATVATENTPRLTNLQNREDQQISLSLLQEDFNIRCLGEDDDTKIYGLMNEYEKFLSQDDYEYLF